MWFAACSRTVTGQGTLPRRRITKADVATYYQAVAPRLLPFLEDRPVTLERLPDRLGEGKPHFWQKNTPASYPAWIPRAELETHDLGHGRLTDPPGGSPRLVGRPGIVQNLTGRQGAP